MSFVAEVDRDGVITARARSSRGARSTWCWRCPGVARRGEMLLHNHPSGHLDPSGRRPQRRGAAARRRRRLRHHRQRRDRALRRRRGAAGPRGRCRIDPFDVVDDAGRAAARSRRSWASTRTGRASATWRPTSPTRYNDGGVLLLEAGTGVGKSLRLPGAGAGLGARQRRAHGRQHQHDQPAGAAGRQGPAAPARGAGAPTTTRRPSPCSRDGGTISASPGCTRRSARSGRCSSRTSSTS